MNDLTESKPHGILAWFASNHVAANLLTVLIIAAGIFSLRTVKIEFFPEMSLDIITVTVPYRGASPDETEQGVTLRVEEAVASVDGIKRLYSTSMEGASVVTIEVEEYANTSDVLDDIKAEVDRIITFPEETEKPIISEIKSRYEVLTIMLYGEVSEQTLKELAEDIKDDLTGLEIISQVDVAGVRPYEIAIEVSEKTLRKYALSFDDVVRAVRTASLDIPGGSVKTAGGEILVRTKGQKYTGKEFEPIIVLTRNDGTTIRLSEIATIIDGFDDSDIAGRFDGRRSALVKVYRVGQQDALKVADAAKAYIEDHRSSLPAGVSADIWQDQSTVLRSRIDLLVRNGRMGLILVFISMALFLDIKLAFWATLGIPVSILGTLWLMPMFGVSVNMISLFAFIMVIGLIVDDAIVIGENIYEYIQEGLPPLQAAITGVREMAMPVLMSILTNQIAFMPLLFVSGIMGKIMRVIPIVVILTFTVSLVEGLLCLPSHMVISKIKTKQSKQTFAGRLHIGVDRMLKWFIEGPFAWVVEQAVRWRYATLAGALMILFITVGLIRGGFVQFTFFNTVEADNMIAWLTMPQGTPPDITSGILDRIEKAAFEVRDEYDREHPNSETSIFRHMATTIGQHPGKRGGPIQGSGGGVSSAHLGEVNVELLDSEHRDISSVVLMNRWREKVGEIAGVSSLNFQSEFVTTGEAINIELTHSDFDQLLIASEDLKLLLRDYSGVFDISDSFEPGKVEIKLSLTEAGRTLGLTLGDLARQARQGFYGDEVQRVQRGKHDVRVMVRYPLNERRSLSDVENMRIRLAGGAEIPFRTVASIDYGRGYATIRRADRKRVVNVTADVDETAANSDRINADLRDKVLPTLMAHYPGLNYRFAGEQRERQESLGTLWTGFPLALLAIFALLAVQFKSYIQPFIVMSAIPFGIIGAVLGHLVLGYNLSLLSSFGIVALSGIVVNDSLIMIDLINRERKEGIGLTQVIRDSVTRRFRPIMLTTLTTCLGLAPMILEKSLQAKFLVPMAISLAFGVSFATMITLVLVPSLYRIVEDIKAFFAWLFARPQEQTMDSAA